MAAQGSVLLSPLVPVLSPLVLQIIIYSVMVVAGLVMFLAYRQSKSSGAAAGKIVAVVCGVIVLGAVLARVFLPGMTQKKAIDELVQQERALQDLAYQKMGAALAEQYPNARIAILHPAIDAGSPMAQPMRGKVAALRAGLGNNAQVVGEQELGQPMGPMANAYISAEDFDGAVEKITETYSILIVLNGLPADYEKTTFYQRQNSAAEETRIKVAVADVNLYPVGKLIKEKFIVCALSPNPKFDPRTKPAGTLEEILPQRFLLITPANVVEIAKAYPNLLPKLE